MRRPGGCGCVVEPVSHRCMRWVFLLALAALHPLAAQDPLLGREVSWIRGGGGGSAGRGIRARSYMSSSFVCDSFLGSHSGLWAGAEAVLRQVAEPIRAHGYSNGQALLYESVVRAESTRYSLIGLSNCTNCSGSMKRTDPGLTRIEVRIDRQCRIRGKYSVLRGGYSASDGKFFMSDDRIRIEPYVLLFSTRP